MGVVLVLSLDVYMFCATFPLHRVNIANNHREMRVEFQSQLGINHDVMQLDNVHRKQTSL